MLCLGSGSFGEVLCKMLRDPSCRTALTSGCLAFVFQQLIGINAIMYYSSIIFESLDSDVDPDSPQGQENSLLYSLAVAMVCRVVWVFKVLPNGYYDYSDE